MPADTPRNSICHIPLSLPLPHSLQCSTPEYFPPSNILLCLLLSSVKNLHDRWARDCATFRELYNLMPNLELKPRIEWGPLFDEKQVSWNLK